MLTAGLTARQNIGCFDVAKELTPLFCFECGRILGATFKDVPDIIFNEWHCSGCLTDIGRIADIIALTTKQDPGNYVIPSGLPNVFSESNVFQLFNKHAIGPKPIDPTKVISWCYEQREKFTEEKTG